MISTDITIRFNTQIGELSFDGERQEISTHTITIKKGKTITIIGSEQNSIGQSFSVEFAPSAFSAKYKSSTHNLLSTILKKRGDDRHTRTLKLKAIDTGVFTIVCRGDWRGTTTNIERYIIQVE